MQVKLHLGKLGKEGKRLVVQDVDGTVLHANDASVLVRWSWYARVATDGTLGESKSEERRGKEGERYKPMTRTFASPNDPSNIEPTGAPTNWWRRSKSGAPDSSSAPLKKHGVGGGILAITLALLLAAAYPRDPFSCVPFSKRMDVSFYRRNSHCRCRYE